MRSLARRPCTRLWLFVFSQDMSWSHLQHPLTNSASSTHSQIAMIPRPQHLHTHPFVQQAFVLCHLSSSFSNHSRSPSTDPGPSTHHQLGSDSQQIRGSIGADRASGTVACACRSGSWAMVNSQSTLPCRSPMAFVPFLCGTLNILLYAC